MTGPDERWSRGPKQQTEGRKTGTVSERGYQPEPQRVDVTALLSTKTHEEVLKQLELAKNALLSASLGGYDSPPRELLSKAEMYVEKATELMGVGGNTIDAPTHSAVHDALSGVLLSISVSGTTIDRPWRELLSSGITLLDSVIARQKMTIQQRLEDSPLFGAASGALKIAVSPLAKVRLKPQTNDVEQNNDRVKAILSEWERSIDPSALTALTGETKWKMASLAARTLASKRDIEEAGIIVDNASGLSLPIPVPPVLYSDRPANSSGRRDSIEQWLKNEFWEPYTKRLLVSAGDLKMLDLSAYNALYGRAKLLSEKAGGKSRAFVVDFFKDNGVLSDETIETPPAELREQVELIKRAQALRKWLRAGGATIAKEER